MHESFVFSGFGGQGVMFAGQLLAYAAMDEGLEVTWIPSYGPEMRGGTAHCIVVISDKPIGSPIVRNPQTALVFNKPSFDKYVDVVAKDGLMVVNSSLIPQAETDRNDLNLLKIPATDLAYEFGNARLTNIILMGAMLAHHNIMTVDMLKHALDGHIPSHRRNMLELNYQAIEKGAQYASNLIRT